MARGSCERDGRAVDGDDLVAIHLLCADYLDRADHADTAPAAELFTENGTLQLGTLIVRGRPAIESFFETRAQQQADQMRCVRHLGGTPAISFVSAHRAHARCTIAVFAGAGMLPLPSAPPATVFDFVDEIERDADGIWRFASRRADVIFTGEGAASFAQPTSCSGEQ